MLGRISWAAICGWVTTQLPAEELVLDWTEEVETATRVWAFEIVVETGAETGSWTTAGAGAATGWLGVAC